MKQKRNGRHLLLFFFLLVLTCVSYSFAAPTESGDAHVGYFIRDNYIRSEKVTSGHVIAVIPAYTVIEYAPDGDTGFARASYDGIEGWLDLANVRVPPEDTETEPFTVYSTENMTLRSLPFDQAAKSDPVFAHSMLTVVGESGAYWHAVCGGQEGYVLKSRVKSTDALTPLPMEAMTVYIPMGTVLTDLPLHHANPLSTVEVYTLHIIRAARGDWYYVEEGELRGWLPKDQVTARRMAQGTAVQRLAAAVMEETEMLTEAGERLTLPENTPLIITADVGTFWNCEAEEKSGYVPKAAVRLIWAEAPLDGYTVTAPEALTALDFPDRLLGKPAGVIAPGEKLSVTAAIRNYLKVDCGAVSGYVAANEALLSAETALMPLDEEIPVYRLMLDKNTRMVYAYPLDEQGETADQPAVYAKVAIGKNTTPTPSGTYLLDAKSRWHRYTRSYTPYNTLYTAARYIHGLPTENRHDENIIDSLSHNAGQMVTGGCLRSPTAFAQWVYLNCSSYITELVIVKGGLSVPEYLTGVDFSD